MLDAAANTIVLVIFGLLIGAVLRIVVQMSDEYNRRSRRGEPFWKSVMRRAEESRERVRTAPRSYKIAAASVYVLLGLLWLAVALSPVQMNWTIFLVSVFAGFGILQGIYALSGDPRVRAAIQSWANRVAGPREVLQGVRVLWVDDRPENNSLERAMLRNRGASVDTARSTDEGLAKLNAANGGYDVIISDMERGGDSQAGMGLLDHLKDRGLPTIFYIGRVDRSRGTPPSAFHITDEPDDLIYAVVRAAEGRGESSR